VLLLEGTTVGQSPDSHGFQDETEVEHSLASLLKRDKRLVVVIASGQNVDRAVSVYRAALDAGREMVLDPYQAYILMTLCEIFPEAPQYGSPSVRVKFVKSHVEKLKEAGLWGLACRMSRAAKVSVEQMKAEPNRYVCLARSSAATVALLRKLESATEPVIVWSQWSGYLSRGGPVPRYCADRGITPRVIHSGGHAHPDDLRELVRRLNPKVIVPIHTEAARVFPEMLPRVRIVPDGHAVMVRRLTEA
ncbi:MAG: hypothetical protein U1E29_12170, partial [Coriobacteriia bacterium]|nr:hypothetical protein [Coriobacteriia bacterium]